MTEQRFVVQTELMLSVCRECFIPYAIPSNYPWDAELFCPRGHRRETGPMGKPVVPANPMLVNVPCAVPPPDPDGASFLEFCQNHGHDPAMHLRNSQTTIDLCPQPVDELVEVKTSKIHGFGAFTKVAVEAGQCAGMALDAALHRTDKVGRYVNHAFDPNCEFLDLREDGSGIQLMAIKDIAPGEELTIDYNLAAALKKKLAP